MKPLRLELSGFTCFREQTSVSFDDLGLFAISGPTGSGKSSLLDAMMYALYGQTPRLGAKGLDALLNPNADQLYVSLEFAAGDANYRVYRGLRRTKSSVQSEVRLDKQQPDATWKQLPEVQIREVNARIEQIVGLDIDSFTRAVLLPQGEFDAFLRGDAASRRKLLVRLSGLERLEAMQREANSRAKEAKTRIDYVTQQLEQDFADATPKRLADLETEQQTLNVRQKALRDEQQTLEQTITAQREVKELSDAKAEAERKKSALVAKEAQIESDRQALQQAKQAALIVPQLERRDRLRQRVSQEKEQVQQLVAQQEAAKEKGAQADHRAQQATTDAATIPDLRARLETLAELSPRLKQLRDLGGDLSLATQAKEDVSYSEAARNDTRTKEAQLPQLARAEREVKRAEQDVAKAEKALADNAAKIAELEKQLKVKTERGTQLGQETEEAEKAHQRAFTENEAFALRQHLHTGEPCPVCNQTVATLPPPTEGAPDVAALKERHENLTKMLQEARDEYRETRSDLKSAQQTQQDRQQAIEQAKQTLVTRQQEVQEAEAPFAELIEELGTRDQKTLQRHLDQVKTWLLADLAATIRKEAGGDDPEAEQTRIRKEIKRLETALKEAQQAQQQAQQDLNSLTLKLQSTRERLAEREQELAEAEEEVRRALSQAEFESAAEVRRAFREEEERQRLSEAIRKYEQQRALVESNLADVEGKLGGRSLDREVFAEQQQRKAAVDGELNGVQRQLGSNEQALRYVREQMERASGLRGEIKALETTYKTYHQLGQDLRGGNFPDYLIVRMQEQLAARASVIMKDLSEGRYDLRLVGGQYQVLDAWHAGEFREVKTLSGGETFMASLSLALALSETVAGNTRLDALFLDEGFGTLDAETLDAVAQVLESLTEQGRMVGIITHVSALSERIPERLFVRKGAEGSSLRWDH